MTSATEPVSDLQCAVTVLLVRPGDRSRRDDGALQLATLAGCLAGRRVARVYAAEAEGGAGTGSRLAAALSVGCTELAAPVGLDVVLAEIADGYRGETVAVVLDADEDASALSLLVPGLTRRWIEQHPLAGSAVAELAGDADGWVCRAWAGGPPGRPGP